MVTIIKNLKIMECHGCNMVFGVTADFMRRRREDSKTFYCPSGHANYYPAGESVLKKAVRLEKELINERLDRRREVQSLQDKNVILRRQKAAQKGLTTKARNKLDRVANGVCPCCNRTFQNLLRHMKTQHPLHNCKWDETSTPTTL